MTEIHRGPEPDGRAPVAVDRALRELGLAVRRSVSPPPAASIRARATRRPPTRAITGLVAAAAVLAILLGVFTAVRDRATAPLPGHSPGVTPTSAPSPRPSRPVPTWPETPLTEPITQVDWNNAIMTLPPHPDPAANCPSGELRLSQGASERYPMLALSSPTPNNDHPVYGDVTGDGRSEAVLHAQCLLTVEDSGDGAGHLLVITREANGTLRALGWVGPRGAFYPAYWVAAGVLFADARPWHEDWGYSIGAVLAYRWQAGRFEEVDSGYLGVQPVTGDPGPEIDLGPVTAWLGCPGGPVRIQPGRSTATFGGYTYEFRPRSIPDTFVHQADLSGDGHRYLLVDLACRRDGTKLGQGVLVLDRNGAGYRAVDLVPVDVRYDVGGWEFARGRLSVVRWDSAGTMVGDAEVWTWNGTYFQ